jgi:tetratricopeptide (TPR) repeat protein
VALDGHYMAEVQLTVLPRVGENEARLLSEANMARQKEGPLLPKLLRAGSSGDILFLASSYSPTLSLADLREDLGPGLRPDLLVRVVWSALNAVTQLHGRGLVHGDLRPCHLELTPKGEFMLGGYLPARHALGIFPEASDARQDYLPPEWQTDGSYQATGDVYALALCVYEVLAGRHLLAKGEDWVPLERMRQLDTGLEDNATLPVPVAPKLASTLGGMLRLEPEKRPSNVLGLLPAFEYALGGSSFKRPLPEVAVPTLLYPKARARSRMLGVARDAFERGHPLVAASCLRRLSSLGVEAGTWEAREAREMLFETLWGALPPGAADDPGKELRALAMALLSYRAARHLGESELLNHARRIMGHWAKADGPLSDLLLAVPQGEEANLEREQYLARLRYDPRDRGALLGLAILDPEGTPPAQSLDERKARLCHALGLPGAGVCHLAAAVTAGRDPADLLTDIATWAQEAGAVPKTAAAPAPPSAPAPAPAPSAPPETPQEPPPEEAPTIAQSDAKEGFGAIRELLDKGDLNAASDLLEELEKGGVLTNEQFFSQVVEVLRNFLWVSMLPAPAAQRKDLALLIVRRVAQAIELTSVLPTCERMLVAAIPEDERPTRLKELLEQAPNSIPVLQAASRMAVTTGDDQAFLQQLLAAGHTFLNYGEMRLASQMFMAVQAVHPDSPEAAEGQDKVMRLATEIATAGQKWEMVERTVSQIALPATALTNVKGFLAFHPTYQAGLEAAAILYNKDGNVHEAARIWLDLAVRALFREEEPLATKYLHRVLRADLENDEALMTLASIRPPGFDAPRELWKLKVSLLEREELWEAAIYQTRTQLTGAPEDFPVLAKLVQLTRKANEDPSSFLVTQAQLAVEMGDEQLAKDCVDEAIETSFDRNTLIDQLVLGVGIEAGYSVNELLIRKH